METLSKAELAEIEEIIHGPATPADGDVTAAGLADWLGLTPNRCHALAREGVLPRNPDNTFPLRRAVRAYADHARAGALGRRADGELAQEKIRLARETADRIAFANARARGELLDAREVATAWRGVIVDLRAALLAVPPRVASRLGMNRTQQAALDVEVRAAMEAISHDH